MPSLWLPVVTAYPDGPQALPRLQVPQVGHTERGGETLTLYPHHGISGVYETTPLSEVQSIMVPTIPTVAAQVSPLHKSLLESATKRFWRFVSKVGDPVNHPDCWEWLGYTNRKGYSLFWDGARTVGAHRFSYELHKGPIPPGLTLDHLCRNRACVNPDHLEAVSNEENILRGVSIFAQNAKKTHCKDGHPFSKANTYLRMGKWRVCRICQLSAQREWNRAHKLQPTTTPDSRQRS